MLQELSGSINDLLNSINRQLSEHQLKNPPPEANRVELLATTMYVHRHCLASFETVMVPLLVMVCSRSEVKFSRAILVPINPSHYTTTPPCNVKILVREPQAYLFIKQHDVLRVT